MTWKVTYTSKIQPHNPVLIEGLPGIGNVGKVAVDFMIEQLNAIKVCEIFSHKLPHSVFVNEDNLVELPTLSMYLVRGKEGKPDILLLAGDVQPIDEVSSYEFSETILNVFQKYNGTHIVTLGGIGLPTAPKKPLIYGTSNSKAFAKVFFKDTKINTNLFGVVGPIIGVSGLLLGLGARRNVDGVALLAETYGHPMYLGIKGAREMIVILNDKFGLKLNIEQIDSEIKEMEKEAASKKADMKDLPTTQPYGEVSYIG